MTCDFDDESSELPQVAMTLDDIDRAFDDEDEAELSTKPVDHEQAIKERTFDHSTLDFIAGETQQTWLGLIEDGERWARPCLPLKTYLAVKYKGLGLSAEQASKRAERDWDVRLAPSTVEAAWAKFKKRPDIDVERLANVKKRPVNIAADFDYRLPHDVQILGLPSSKRRGKWVKFGQHEDELSTCARLCGFCGQEPAITTWRHRRREVPIGRRCFDRRREGICSIH